MTIPDSLQTLGEFAFDNCLMLVPSTVDVSEDNNDDPTSEVVAHLRFQQLLSGNNFLNTDDFRRLLIPFISDDTLMATRAVSKPWLAVADEFISDGVESGAMMVHDWRVFSYEDVYAQNERRKLITRVIFLLNITKVGNYACMYAVNLVVVDIPEGVKRIGAAAFHHCKSLTTLSFPRTLTLIGEAAFRDCPSLENIDLRHTNLAKLSGLAFYNCSELKSITIPDSLQTIGGYAFKNCSKLVPSSINIHDNNAVIADLRSHQHPS
ncbi:hypothetical protein TrLO_g2066 [Triparma laevis f. longispina]|uniref:Leucine-rich repeat domain-containing protein n=1 Tax=Triparma laevis f. longispina TaxID=1714387 RepID=A0A9W7KYE5_9STRA|nr:hypothetical protein TrLO_g2066 [Triparma laevis f. longispina]